MTNSPAGLPRWITYEDLETLKPNGRNPKAHVSLAESYKRYGFVEPIVVDERTGMLAAGHGRREELINQKAAGQNPPDGIVVKDGKWLVPVGRGWSSKTDQEAEEYLVASNALGPAGGWNDLLDGIIKGALDRNVPLLELGVSKSIIDSILAQQSRDQDPDAPAPPTPVNPISKTGDLWILGNHRILCGDSTSEEDVKRLMNGKRAVICSTDPPYLVDYTGEDHPQSYDREKTGRSNNKNWDSYKDPESSVEFFAKFIKLALEHALIESPAIYQWHAARRQKMVEEAWIQCGLLFHQQIIWVKDQPVLTRSDFMWKHEPCLYGWVAGNRPNLRPTPSGDATSVWAISQKGERDGIHPTQKPVEIFARPITYHTNMGDIVYEPFSGSGSQIIAAEQSRRCCYAMEQAPEFVDVAVKRWQEFTGLKAAKEDGTPFDQ